LNHTLTNFADHVEELSHDAINRFLRSETMTPRLVWDNVKREIIPHRNGCIVFDDTVLHKDFSHKIELVRRQYGGNAHGLVKGIGMVNCVYVNPESGAYWIVDFRHYDPEGGGKSKLDHVQDMLTNLVHDKRLLFDRVLMDTWYATCELMLLIESLSKIFYCPLRDNRQVDDSAGQSPYRRIDSLVWNEVELERGKMVKIKGVPKDHKVKLFRVAVSTHRTDWVVTNDLAQDSLQATQDACRLRWKIEQFHREAKQLTGIEGCQCRKARSIYRVKHALLDDFLRQELRNPSLKMALA
jgi:hypothetical protein